LNGVRTVRRVTEDLRHLFFQHGVPFPQSYPRIVPPLFIGGGGLCQLALRPIVIIATQMRETDRKRHV